jgi:hypothetical protein
MKASPRAEKRVEAARLGRIIGAAFAAAPERAHATDRDIEHQANTASRQPSDGLRSS